MPILNTCTCSFFFLDLFLFLVSCCGSNDCFFSILNCLQGVKEIILLGQNVNSYRDVTPESFQLYGARYDPTRNSAGFNTIYHNKEGGLRFADLLHEVVQVNKEIRFGFTSPHPKDFPDEVSPCRVLYGKTFKILCVCAGGRCNAWPVLLTHHSTTPITLTLKLTCAGTFVEVGKTQ